MSKEQPVKATRGIDFGKALKSLREGRKAVDERLIISENMLGREIAKMLPEGVGFVLGELAKMQESARNNDNPKHLLSQEEKEEIATRLGEEVMKNPSRGYRSYRAYPKSSRDAVTSPDSEYYVKETRPWVLSDEDSAKDKEINERWEANKLLKDVLETGKRQSDVLKKLKLVTRERSSNEKNSHVVPLEPTNFSK